MNDTANDSLAIRTARISDLPALQRVYREASLSNPGDAPALLAQPEFLVFGGDAIPDGRTRLAAAGPTDLVVGFASTSVNPDGQLELDDLFVDPGWRRRGIARRLITDIAGTSRVEGYRLLSVVGNPHASDFYRAVGFVEVGRTETALGVGLQMCLDLANH